MKTGGVPLKLGILFQRLGPYHHARLRVAAERFDLVAIQASAIDGVYGWDMVVANGDFPCLTLFHDQDVRTASAGEIKRRIDLELSRIGPDVVAIPGWSEPTDLAALQWCLGNRIPAIVMSDSTARDRHRSHWKEAIKRRIVRQFSAGFVAGRPHADYLQSLGMPANRIQTGYDVVDNAHFASGAGSVRRNAAQLRANLGLPERYWLVICRFIKEKNLDRLLDAYALYLRRPNSRQWGLVLLGDGPLKAEVRAGCQRLGIESSVLMPGFVQYDELPAYYGLAEALILPSVSESWGLVVNEAMAAGLPVLVSRHCGCVPDLVTEGHNGYSFDPYDAGHLAELMTRLEADEDQMKVMGQAGQEIIMKFTPTTFANGLVKVADIAVSAPRAATGWFDRALLWSLMRR